MADWGVTWTDLWLMNAWLDPLAPWTQPWVQESDGRWNLERFSEEWFHALIWFVETCAEHGIVTMLTPMDRFVLSKVPDPLHPVRHNVQGAQWGEPSEDAWLFGPLDPYLCGLWAEVQRRLGDKARLVRLANEFPEKPWHFNFETFIRSLDPDVDIVCNRQGDSPGQPINMEVGKGRIDRYQFHGQVFKQGLPAYDVVWDDETAAGRPDTYRKLFDASQTDMNRIIVCSDGGRNGGGVTNGYDYPAWTDVFSDVLRRGGNVCHQSCIKLADPHAVENMQYDAPMMEALAKVTV